MHRHASNGRTLSQFWPHTWAVDNEHAGLHNSALRYDQSSRSQAKEPVPDAALKYVVGKNTQRRETWEPRPLPNFLGR